MLLTAYVIRAGDGTLWVLSSGLEAFGGLMRIVAWNCNMALHRKAEALLRLKPDVAVVSECASPDILRSRGAADWMESPPVWCGDNPNKGLGIFAFNGYRVHAVNPAYAYLRHVLPATVSGAMSFKLLGVWAQNASGGNTRKHQLGPLRRSLSKHASFLRGGSTVVAGDFNNNCIWDRPGWRINHRPVVERLAGFGIESVYHAVMDEEQGAESVPTHYWRDRRKDGPTYHIDYIFAPDRWLNHIRRFDVGTFEDWCGSRLSDHVPLILDIDERRLSRRF